jgi:hypothetical protein
LLFTSFPICYLAVIDKDVTYEQVLSEEEEAEYHKDDNYTGWTDEGSYIPTRRMKILPLIKKNFQYLYHTTQSGAPFGWNSFFWEAVNSLCMATILCLVGYNVYAGTVCMHRDGHTSDFWMASFGIYAALVFGTTAVVLVRTSQITWIYLIFFIFFFSLVPFFLLSYLFDTMLVTTPNLKEYVMVNLSETHVYYLYFILFTGLSILVEVGFLFIRYYYKPTLADYFRWLIKNNKADSEEYFDQAILQNFKRLQDPIPKKVEIEWSDVISRSQIEEKSNEIEKEDNYNPEDVQKPDEYKSLNSADLTTNFNTNLTTPHEDQSKRSIFVMQNIGHTPEPAQDHNTQIPESPNLLFSKPRRISSQEFPVPNLEQMEQELEEDPPK